MTTEIIKFIKTNALIAAMIVALATLGVTINTLVPWEWLTALFVIIRRLLLMFDFIIDTSVLINLIGIALSLKIALWAYQGTIVVIDWFKNH